LEFFFSDLNWTFIFMFVICLYGLKHKAEFRWYNNLFNSNPKIKDFKIWVAGLIIGTFFCFFRWLDDTAVFNSNYVSTMLRSWLVVIVFNSVFTDKISDLTNEKPQNKPK
jgi:hypothetical protein